jgi:hypothetical protein
MEVENEDVKVDDIDEDVKVDHVDEKYLCINHEYGINLPVLGNLNLTLRLLKSTFDYRITLSFLGRAISLTNPSSQSHYYKIAGAHLVTVIPAFTLIALGFSGHIYQILINSGAVFSILILLYQVKNIEYRKTES